MALGTCSSMMEVLVVKQQGRQGLLAFMALVVLIVALPTALAESKASPALPDSSPNFDRLLSSVRAATPSNVRLLVLGDPPVVSFYRATYQLYPRRVYNAAPPDAVFSLNASPLYWPHILRLARHTHARFVVLWGVSVAPRTAIVRLRQGPGELIEVSA